MYGNEFDLLDKELQKLGRKVTGYYMYGGCIHGKIKFNNTIIMQIFHGLANKGASVAMDHVEEGNVIITITNKFGGGLSEEIMSALIHMKNIYKNKLLPYHGK